MKKYIASRTREDVIKEGIEPRVFIQFKEYLPTAQRIVDEFCDQFNEDYMKMYPEAYITGTARIASPIGKDYLDFPKPYLYCIEVRYGLVYKGKDVTTLEYIRYSHLLGPEDNPYYDEGYNRQYVIKKLQEQVAIDAARFGFGKKKKYSKATLGGPTRVTYEMGGDKDWPDQFQQACDNALDDLGLERDADRYGVTLYYPDDPDYSATIENDEFNESFLDLWQSSKSISDFNNKVIQYLSMYL